jgi:hypothetical protein
MMGEMTEYAIARKVVSAFSSVPSVQCTNDHDQRGGREKCPPRDCPGAEFGVENRARCAVPCYDLDVVQQQ